MTDLGRSPQAGRATHERSQVTQSPPAVSVPNALRLPISTDLDPAATGEFILSYINSEERWGYSTRDFLRGNFREVDDVAPLDVRTICCGCWANSPGEGDAVRWWHSDELGLDVFLRWDGDGTVVFKSPDWTLENGDCKNDHDWEWVTDGHWSINYEHYEDEASAIEAQRATTPQSGVVHESAVPERQTPTTEGDS